MAILSGCGKPGPEPAAQPAPAPHNAAEVRKALTEAMIQEHYCYMSSLEYAIHDPDFLDQVLQRLLGKTTLQEVAEDPREFENLLREAPSTYTAVMETEDGLERLSRVIAERFARPVITVNGVAVRADYGHIAAKITPGMRGKIGISFSQSPHLDENWEWRTPEVATALKGLLDKYPEATLVEVRVLIPGGMKSTGEWLYSYRPDNDRVRIHLASYPPHEYYTKPIGGDFGPYLRGETSLDTRFLESPGYR